MVNDKKVSIVIPTLNEEKNIEKLILSLINQNFEADEIIISDGGSVDSTINVINKLQKIHKKIKLSGRKGSCRGAGRNSAIEYSKNNIVALIDSGTTADKYWLENLYSTMNKKNLSIVFGSIKSNYTDVISRNIANIIYGRNNHNETLSYSVSSMLIKKDVWKSLGKFPESDNGDYVVEDLRFINSIKKSSIKYEIEKKAFVFWELPDSFYKIYKRYKEYSIGAVSNNYSETWHIKVLRNYTILFIMIISISYFVGVKENIFLLPLMFLRSNFYLRNKDKYKNRFISMIYDHLFTSLILILIDICAIIGIVESKIKKYFLK
tara:strand:+ start:239 stop:1201 length:963 start_codon:yes stop_codon:yes gene_type:complete